MNQFMHRHTPTLTVFDPRGLSVRAVTCYRAAPLELVQARVTMQSYNPVGLLSRQWDPRLFAAWQQDETVEPNQSTVYSLSGQALHSANVDAGWRTQLNGEMGQLLGSWDGRGSHSRVEYDALVRHRLTLSSRQAQTSVVANACIMPVIHSKTVRITVVDN